MTFKAENGSEIIELNIRKGVLHGIEQQRIDESSRKYGQIMFGFQLSPVPIRKMAIVHFK